MYLSSRSFAHPKADFYLCCNKTVISTYNTEATVYFGYVKNWDIYC